MGRPTISRDLGFFFAQSHSKFEGDPPIFWKIWNAGTDDTATAECSFFAQNLFFTSDSRIYTYADETVSRPFYAHLKTACPTLSLGFTPKKTKKDVVTEIRGFLGLSA